GEVVLEGPLPVELTVLVVVLQGGDSRDHLAHTCLPPFFSVSASETTHQGLRAAACVSHPCAHRRRCVLPSDRLGELPSRVPQRCHAALLVDPTPRRADGRGSAPGSLSPRSSWARSIPRERAPWTTPFSSPRPSPPPAADRK